MFIFQLFAYDLIHKIVSTLNGNVVLTLSTIINTKAEIDYVYVHIDVSTLI